MRTFEYHVQRAIRELVQKDHQVTYDNIQDQLWTHGCDFSIEYIKRALEQECEKNVPKERLKGQQE